MSEWDDLIGVVQEIVAISFEIRYVGWDFTHTDDGWALMECNDGRFVGRQMTVHNGR